MAHSLQFELILETRRAQVRAELVPILAHRPSDSPLVLEIGSGHGHFLTAYAAAHPKHWCIGIDVMRDRTERAHKKKSRAGHPNLHFIRAEANEFLKYLPDLIRFDHIFVLFPDPWPKTRHHKNRLLGPRFFSHLADRCQPKAQLYFRTDHVPYFADVKRIVDQHPQWEDQPHAAWPFEEPTVFERRAKFFKSLLISYKDAMSAAPQPKNTD